MKDAKWRAPLQHSGKLAQRVFRVLRWQDGRGRPGVPYEGKGRGEARRARVPYLCSARWDRP